MGNLKLLDKDREILFELSLNSRASLTELARRTGMSKQALSYRLGLLEKNKVILGYHAITNIYLLGRTHYRVFIKYENMSAEKEQELVQHLIENPKISWMAYLDGDLDLVYLVWAKSIQEFETVYDEVNDKFGTFFQEKQLSIATRIEYVKYRFLSDKKGGENIIFGGTFGEIVLDKLDKKILERININCRESLVEISQACNSNPKTVRVRINALEKKNVIAGYNVKIEHKKLGFTHRKIFLKLNDVSKEKINALSSYLRGLKSTIYLIKPIGNYDFEFEMMTKSNEEFHNTIKRLRTKFAENIKNHSSVIVYTEPKSGQMKEF